MFQKKTLEYLLPQCGGEFCKSETKSTGHKGRLINLATLKFKTLTKDFLNLKKQVKLEKDIYNVRSIKNQFPECIRTSIINEEKETALQKNVQKMGTGN